MGTVIYVYGKLPAQDIRRAERFYKEKLGLIPFAEANDHLFYEVQGVRFVIFPSSGAPSGTHDQLGLVVEDLKVEVASLRSKGVLFETFPGLTGEDGIMDRGSFKTAWFRDSEGNLISFAQNPPSLTTAPQVAGTTGV
jgi:catechol 2,3-dioxygenase-like lactoylglutathione lyase family enzyme